MRYIYVATSSAYEAITFLLKALVQKLKILNYFSVWNNAFALDLVRI